MLLFLDAIGATCAIISTALFVQMNRYGWLVGILSSIINAILFFETKLYADGNLEIYFFYLTFIWLVLLVTLRNKTRSKSPSNFSANEERLDSMCFMFEFSNAFPQNRAAFHRFKHSLAR